MHVLTNQYFKDQIKKNVGREFNFDTYEYSIRTVGGNMLFVIYITDSSQPDQTFHL